MPMDRLITRRQALAAVGGLTAGALVAPRTLLAAATDLAGNPVRSARPVAAAASDSHHLAWVWTFRQDGDPARIRDTLAANGLGIALKTHDGVEWMSKYDSSANAISGPTRIQQFANFFERGGVPFYAWALVEGADPDREARMASDVLSAGARGLFYDLESYSGFWVGSRSTASRFGQMVRRYQPNAWMATSVDSRPWEIDRIPLAEFASFTNAIAPQVYWKSFQTPANAIRYISSGEPVSVTGITPAFVMRAANRKLAPFGLPIHPIGDGTVSAQRGWSDFVSEAYSGQSDAVSVWRYGVAEPGIWQLLGSTPPRSTSYVVQPGDTLIGIAAQWSTTAAAVAYENGITDPNHVMIGTRLRRPGWGPGPNAR